MTSVAPREIPAGYAFDDAFRSRARANVTRFARRAIDRDGRRPAAVAAVLLPDERGNACFLLTRRAATLRDHKGQWALPGGRIDGAETAMEAALRELEEEVGLTVDPSAVLGCLDDYGTRSGFIITPVVVSVTAVGTLTPNPTEVAHVYRVPFTELDHPDVPRTITIPESDRPVIQLPLMSTLIHAPTAAVIYQMREVVVHGRATRVDHYEQPVWAWR
ncbi:MAG: CoA pyrophosphatase [Candidatus Rokuibacteriota bacterium]